VVAPGEVVGIDIEAAQIERATAAAAAQHVTNARFKVGDAYPLPFPDAAFDVVFAHTLLNHLDEPMRALREFRRVLKPGGLVAVRDRDLSSLCIYEPSTPLTDEVRTLQMRFMGQHGTLGNSRRMRGALIEAGFDHAEMAAVSEYYGSDATLPELAHTIASIFRSPAFRRAVADNGWADEETIERLIEGVHTWAQRPDAFFAMISFSALGWVATDT
jgi:ubiquinone/menaquinone biosynthesis C-methylase UbiE